MEHPSTASPVMSRVHSESGTNPVPFSRPASPSLRAARYAFVGLGEMGKRMAVNFARSLVDAGLPPLLVYNRSPEGVNRFKAWAKDKELPEDAYTVVNDLQEIARVANLIVTSLSNDEAAESVYEELFAGQEAGSAAPAGDFHKTIFVDTTTTYPTTAGKLERTASSKPNRAFVACPVFGVPRAAEKADLILGISGDYRAKKVAAHVLCPAIGKKVMDLGSNVERALSFKLVGNALELGFIELIAECFTLADQAGVGSDQIVELIRLQHASPALVRYSERISKNKFDATGGFNLAGGMQDARHIRQLADSHNVPMPAIDLAHQHMITARAQGGDQLDWTALVGGQRMAAGLPPFAGKTRVEKWEE